MGRKLTVQSPGQEFLKQTEWQMQTPWDGNELGVSKAEKNMQGAETLEASWQMENNEQGATDREWSGSLAIKCIPDLTGH